MLYYNVKYQIGTEGQKRLQMISNTRWSSKSRALTRIFGSFQDPDSSVQFIQDPESSSLMTMKRLKMMPVMMVRIRNYQVVVDSLGCVEDTTIARHVYVCFLVVMTCIRLLTRTCIRHTNWL